MSNEGTGRVWGRPPSPRPHRAVQRGDAQVSIRQEGGVGRQAALGEQGEPERRTLGVEGGGQAEQGQLAAEAFWQD